MKYSPKMSKKDHCVSQFYLKGFLDDNGGFKYKSIELFKSFNSLLHFIYSANSININFVYNFYHLQ